MKIRQAKKLLKSHQGYQPNTRVTKAIRCIRQRTMRRKRKRTRGSEACLVRGCPIKIWAGDQFLGYASSITIKLP